MPSAPSVQPTETWISGGLPVGIADRRGGIFEGPTRLLLTTKRKQTVTPSLKTRRPLNVIHGSARFAKFNRARDNSLVLPEQPINAAVARDLRLLDRLAPSP